MPHPTRCPPPEYVARYAKGGDDEEMADKGGEEEGSATSDEEHDFLASSDEDEAAGADL